MTNVIIGNKYKALELLGEGSFGKVFKGKHLKNDSIVAIKIQHKDISHVLKHEAKIYNLLRDISGIPQMRNYGTDSGFNYLIIEFLGPSLFETKITPEKSILFFIQSLNILEKVHDMGFLHRDIKPDNFLLTEKKALIELYLIDFGLAKYYLNADKKHMEERKGRKLIGTAKFSSLNVHNGIEPSRRDDIESLVYTFITVYGQELPWTKVIAHHNSGNIKEKIENIQEIKREEMHNSETDISQNINTSVIIPELYEKIKLSKERTLEWLYNIPGEFLTLLLYSRKLEFEERPNYNYIRRLLNNLRGILPLINPPPEKN
jgi:serine/threonine protein kinase